MGKSSSCSQAVYARSAISDRGAIRIPLEGVPQIPDAAHRLFAAGVEEIHDEQLRDEFKESIDAAKREIRRRTERDRRRSAALAATSRACTARRSDTED